MPERAEQLERCPTAPASRRRGWLLVSLLLAGGMLAYLVVWLLGTDQGTQVQRLSDGSALSYLGYTYGRKHEFLTGPRWQKLLWPIAPAAWRERLSGVGRMYRLGAPGSLTVWTRCTNVPANSKTPRFCAVDEHGCELWTDHFGAYGGEGAGAENLEPLGLEVFPRRGARFRVRVSREKSQYEAAPEAEFIVPNPDPGPHRTWRLPRLPTSSSQDGFTFTLDRIVTGLRPNAQPGPLRSDEIPCSRFDYHVRRNGRDQPEWYAKRMEWFDATGNHQAPQIRLAVAYPRDARCYAWQGGLCTQEAYRLHVEFTADRPLDASDLWTIKDVRIPPPGQTYGADWTGFGQHNSGAHVYRLGGVNTHPAGRWSNFWQYWPGCAFIYLNGMGSPDRVWLVRAVDQQGHDLRPNGMDHPVTGTDRGEVVFAIKPPPDGQTVNLTFGFRRSYFMDFVARPIAASDAAKQPH